MSDASHALHRETEAARVLVATYRDLLADDDQARADMVEGETNIQEAIRAGLVRLAELRAMGVGIDSIADQLQARRSRLADQQASLREAILLAMELAGLPKFETDVGTITRKRTPPSVVVVDEADIPSMFWKPSDPKLDKRAVLDALKGGETVPGAQLSNGGETIQVRWE
jgi:hypothetical protein